MLDLKEHKKMYKVGKHWAVATLIAAGMLMGSTSAVHADEEAQPVTNNQTTQVVNEDV